MNVIAGRFDGIGTRLLTFMAARYFVEVSDLPLVFTWPSLNDPLYDSKDLLSFSSASEIFENGRVFTDMKACELLDWPSVADVRFFQVSKMDWGDTPSFDKVLECASGFDAILYDMPYAVLDAPGRRTSKDMFASYWKAFNFDASLAEARKLILRATSCDYYAAIHMRRGDAAKMLSDGSIDFLQKHGFDQLFQRYLPIRQAKGLIEQNIHLKVPILVVSEDGSMPSRLAKILPQRNIIGTTGVFDQRGTRQALLDLLMLANSTYLLSPACSFFSECAARVGDTVNLKASINISLLAQELFDGLSDNEQSDADFRKSLFLEAGARSGFGSDDELHIMRLAAASYRRKSRRVE